MHFTTILAVSASLLTLGYAADSLSFTSWPAEIAAGKPVTLTWTGGNTNGVGLGQFFIQTIVNVC